MGFALILFHACGGDSPTPPAEPPAGSHTLTVVASPGIAGAPAAGEHVFDADATVQYTYAALPGYDSILVADGGTRVAASGTLTMDRDVRLLVLADSVLEVTDANADLVDALREVLTNPSPMEALRRFQTEQARLFATTPRAEAIRELAVARAIAYDGVRDAERLYAAALEIGDSLLVEDEAPAAPRDFSTQSRAETPTTFIYVNGINTDGFAANGTLHYYLRPVLDEAGFGDHTRFPYRRAWNASAKVASNGDALACLVNYSGAVIYGRQWTQIFNMHLCFGVAYDFGQAVRQQLGQILGLSAQTSDVDHAVRIALGVHAGGSRVVFVAHSQGNLIVNDALAELAQQSPALNMGCFGVVSIAPPRAIDGNGASVSQMIAGTGEALDILRLIGLADGVDLVPNSLSDSRNAWAPLSIEEKVEVGLSLHDINLSYLTLTGTRQAIVGALQAQEDSVRQHCPAIDSPNIQVRLPYPNTQIPVGGGNVVMDVPVEVTIHNPPLLGSEPVYADLFLTVYGDGWSQSRKVWTSQPTDFTVAGLNASGSMTVTARIHMPSAFVTAFYSLTAQVRRDGVTFTQAEPPALGLIHVIPFSLSQLPYGFPSDAAHPAMILPMVESYVMLYGTSWLPSGRTMNLRQSSATFHVGEGETTQSVYTHYETYLRDRGYSVTATPQDGVLYGIIDGPSGAPTDCLIVITSDAGKVRASISFAHRFLAG